MDQRLPAHLEIAAMIRLSESRGGSAMVLAKGERDAGTILLVTMCRAEGATLFEKMPQLDGTRPFIAVKSEDPENKQIFSEYLLRRAEQDPDIWILEVDVDDPAQFVALLPR